PAAWTPPLNGGALLKKPPAAEGVDTRSGVLCSVPAPSRHTTELNRLAIAIPIPAMQPSKKTAERHPRAHACHASPGPPVLGPAYHSKKLPWYGARHMAIQIASCPLRTHSWSLRTTYAQQAPKSAHSPQP